MLDVIQFLNEQSLDRTQWIKHAAGVEQCVPYELHPFKKP